MYSLPTSTARKWMFFGLAVALSAWLLLVTTKSMLEKSILAKSQAESLPAIIAVNKVSGLPKPGSYMLQKIFPVPALKVLDANGKRQAISRYTKGKITLLTFFYERCSDANGCPYVMNLFHTVKSKLESNEATRNAVRLVHISFDPERDTPLMMADLQRQTADSPKHSGVARKVLEWDFLTTASVDELLPVVNGFGQNVDINLNPATGDKTLTYSHVLKAFLIDGQGYVREIYSTNYISAEMLLNDIQTLALEKSGR